MSEWNSGPNSTFNRLFKACICRHVCHTVQANLPELQCITVRVTAVAHSRCCITCWIPLSDDTSDLQCSLVKVSVMLMALGHPPPARSERRTLPHKEGSSDDFNELTSPHIQEMINQRHSGTRTGG